MSTSLEDLKELDNFDSIKTFIKTIVLTNESLFRLIYFCYSNPFDTNCSYPEDPYLIFNESSLSTNNSNKNHGVLLFKQKDSEILNYEVPVILISFSSETSQDSDCINTIIIDVSIILKGENIQTLNDGSSRAYKIAKLFDDNFNHSQIDNVGIIKRKSFEKVDINEGNSGYSLKFTFTNTSYNDSIQLYIHTQSDDEYGITRESYNLLVTTEPILVDIRPLEDNKSTTDYGYDAVIKRRMICNIIPEITESTVIEHNNTYYRIEKYIEYDDYMDYTLIEAKRITIN